jgi:hypothetical protein
MTLKYEVKFYKIVLVIICVILGIQNSAKGIILLTTKNLVIGDPIYLWFSISGVTLLIMGILTLLVFTEEK